MDDVPASTTQTLNVLNGADTYIFFAIGTALLVSATGIAVLRHGGLPRWLGGASVVHGLVSVSVLMVGVFVSGLGFLGFLLLVYWVPLVAVLIYKREVTLEGNVGRALSP
ncbi:MAG: hypothetical protein QOJ60_1356 [Actinomycetota bacterium]|nr:hypothetical protein [Actinomycetota bacterium]